MESAVTMPLSAADRIIGRVTAVTGSQATVLLELARNGRGERATVGKFLALHGEKALLIGVVTSVSTPPNAAEQPAHASAQIDLLGEIRQHPGGGRRFDRGTTEYPAVGDTVRHVDRDELSLVYAIPGGTAIDIGHLQQDPSIGARVDVDDMLSKHFALFGTTGVGKSSGVALILRAVLEARPDLRIFLIDPHNEYGRCFEDRAYVLTPRNLKLPFWLFNFEEIVDVFYRGRPGVEEEVEILAEIIPLAKSSFAAERSRGDRSSVRRNDPKSSGYTIDTPVPYQLTELLALLNERIGKLENRAAWGKYQRLLARIDAVRNDPRYGFMFDNANVGGDTMTEVLSQLFRLPIAGKPLTIMQLAGFPAEVVDSVVSVVGRMAFDFGLWSDGAVPLLFVCEEAHRYAPADRALGFGPTRKALSRIAKEGRKYGVYLGLITQRPAELDATIISQCSTLFAMRMANDRDQAIVRAAVSDAAASLLAFVPALGTREVFAFGQGVPLPTRLHFKELPADAIPRSESMSRGRMDTDGSVDAEFIEMVIERWRGAMMGQRARPDDDMATFEALATEDYVAGPRTGYNPELFGHLVKSGGVPANSPIPPTIRDSSPPPSPPPVPGPSPSFSADLQELRRRLRARGLT